MAYEFRRKDSTVAGFIFSGEDTFLIKHKKLGLWLPVGGHVEPNEVPDDAMAREAKEEANLYVRVLSEPRPYHAKGEVRQLAIPFDANVHSVGDHDHYCYVFICESKNRDYALKKDEVLDGGWFGLEEAARLYDGREGNSIVRHAFEKYKILRKQDGDNGQKIF